MLRTAVQQWFAGMVDGRETSIEPQGVILDEDFAVTYVAATTTIPLEAGGSKIEMIKLVHSWRPTDDGWKIVGGMCGPLER